VWKGCAIVFVCDATTKKEELSLVFLVLVFCILLEGRQRALTALRSPPPFVALFFFIIWGEGFVFTE